MFCDRYPDNGANPSIPSATIFSFNWQLFFRGQLQVANTLEKYQKIVQDTELGVSTEFCAEAVFYKGGAEGNVGIDIGDCIHSAQNLTGGSIDILTS
jgi:hypothetical protein